MHIGICVNHSFPHVGGCEKVVQQVSEGLVSHYGHQCTIYSRSHVGEPLMHNGVKIKGVHSLHKAFLESVKEDGIERLFVYSDMFVHWKAIVEFIDTLPFRVAIAPVGMNKMQMHRDIFKKFIEKKERFDVIAHSSNYMDYKICQKNSLSVEVIPNAVDLAEFDRGKYRVNSFRRKYGIKTTNLILNVSNFFPGKGQLNFVDAIEEFSQLQQDSTFVFICSTIQHPSGDSMLLSVKEEFSKFKCKTLFLKDIPREDTVGAFMDADVFAFSSEKEVAPLVVLESMAAQLPWVSFPVGNVPTLEGGIIVDAPSDGQGGFHVYGPQRRKFSQAIQKILSDKELRKSLGIKGRQVIEEKYSLDTILGRYNEILTQKG